MVSHTQYNVIRTPQYKTTLVIMLWAALDPGVKLPRGNKVGVFTVKVPSPFTYTSTYKGGGVCGLVCTLLVGG